MLKLLLPVTFAFVVGQKLTDPATRQLANFKIETSGPINILTTSAGAPVTYEDTKSSLNSNLLSNEFFMDSVTSLVRERTPERVVHASGTGAFGYFEATHDISHICKAKLFEVGKKTPLAVRFSLGFSLHGVTDTTRDLRAAAYKFYTKEGNLDLIGFNTPIFAFKDPLLTVPLIHAGRRNPETNLHDPNMLWDYVTQNPENFFIFLYFFSDLGTPYGYRHMPSFPAHTYEVYNEHGQKFMVRWHFDPDLGIKNFNATGAMAITAVDPDFYTRDLYNAIKSGNYPSWQLSAQILTPEDVAKADIDVYDITLEIPLEQFPKHPIGKIVLNKNPTNHFAEVERLAFCPGNLVPGILGSPDIVFESRRLAYRDAAYYRLGKNFNKIPVNCPLRAHTYNRNGVPPLADNGRNAPNYFPNSFNGAVPVLEKNRPSLSKIHEKPPNNFKQAGKFYSKLTSTERSSLVQTMVTSMCSVENFIIKRALKWLKIIHHDLENRVVKTLKARKCF